MYLTIHQMDLPNTPKTEHLNILINLLETERYEDIIAYADIMYLIHNSISKFDELIESLRMTGETANRYPWYDRAAGFVAYLLYKLILNNDVTTIKLLRGPKRGDIRITDPILVGLLTIIYKENNMDFILSNKWIIYDIEHIWMISYDVIYHIIKFIIE